jgi:hypothetical protein
MRMAVAVLLAFLAIPALADPPKVEVMAEVVLASNKDNTIEPPELAKMKDKFGSAGFSFTSYRRLSVQKVALVKVPPTVLDLPNQKKVQLKLEDLKDGTATVRLEIAKLINTTVSLGKEGSVFQHAGPHDGGQLFLVLTSPK